MRERERESEASLSVEQNTSFSNQCNSLRICNMSQCLAECVGWHVAHFPIAFTFDQFVNYRPCLSKCRKTMLMASTLRIAWTMPWDNLYLLIYRQTDLHNLPVINESHQYRLYRWISSILSYCNIYILIIMMVPHQVIYSYNLACHHHHQKLTTTSTWLVPVLLLMF